MTTTRLDHIVRTDEAVANGLRLAARDESPVSGLTHTFYRYPARFSPRFVRAAIQLLTERGDLVVDPFMGGGTTLVEALSLGRFAIGSDISALATFVAEVKTTVLSEREIYVLRRWSEGLPHAINMHVQTISSPTWVREGYHRHLDRIETWRLRKAIEQALATATCLASVKLEQFARCVILRTAQWALDARRRIPTVDEFRTTVMEFAMEMLEGARELAESVRQIGIRDARRVICLNRSAADLNQESVFEEFSSPRLVLTSPPYPGIHMLYHRWQVDGRKESPAPFWIANRLDGAGEKHYSMGCRKEAKLRSYYQNLCRAFTSLRKLCGGNTIVVQVVAFASPSWQLPSYLEALHEAGLHEIFLPGENQTEDGRLWRKVPNRRWHADQMGETPGSNEVVLFHTPTQSKQPHRRSPIDARRPHLTR